MYIYIISVLREHWQKTALLRNSSACHSIGMIATVKLLKGHDIDRRYLYIDINTYHAHEVKLAAASKCWKKSDN